MVLLAASVAIGVSLVLWRSAASCLTPRATDSETAPFYKYLHLSRRTRITTTHACVLLSLLSACPFSIAGSIGVGQFHSCALTASGGVRCWGRGDLGQASAVHAWSISASAPRIEF